MTVLGALGGVLSTILAWLVMLILNAIAWAIILFLITMVVCIGAEHFNPESPWNKDLLSIMMFLDFVAYIVLATLCVEGPFRLIPLFW